MWLAGTASFLANQGVGVESDDVSTLQQKQRELKVRKRDTSDIYLYIVRQTLMYDYWQKGGGECSLITHYFTQNLNCVF